MADPFESIELDELDDVTGGRYARLGAMEVKPELIEAIKMLAQSLQAVQQGKASQEQQKWGNLMQLVQYMGGAKKG